MYGSENSILHVHSSAGKSATEKEWNGEKMNGKNYTRLIIFVRTICFTAHCFPLFGADDSPGRFFCDHPPPFVSPLRSDSYGNGMLSAKFHRVRSIYELHAFKRHSISVNKLTDDKLFLNYSNDNLVHIVRVHTLTQTFRRVLCFFSTLRKQIVWKSIRKMFCFLMK